MKPSEVSTKLRQIASAIDKSQKPQRDLVAADLKKVAIALTGKTVSDFTGEVGSYDEGDNGNLQGTINIDGNNVNIEGSWNSGSRGIDFLLDGQDLDRLDPLYDVLDNHFVNLYPAQAWPQEKYPNWKADYQNDQVSAFNPV